MESTIVLEDVHVRYSVLRERVRSLKQFAIQYAHRKIQYLDVHALTAISLQVQPGEVLGVLGQNGAGKSTLMRVLARVLPPTQGAVFIRGRIAPLLDLYSSFSPELTGAENIYLTGAILGLTRQEMDRRYDAIVEFAELHEFIDAPMRTYSGGMSARLGFAVATSVDADVLLIDEVLAVGDEQFQAKCQARIAEYQRRGATIVIVSHSPEIVRKLCDRGLWLDQGKMQLWGDARQVASAYQRFLRTDAFRGTRFFHPNWFVPRADFVRMLVRAYKLPLITPDQPTFADVPPASAFYPYIETAYARGWISGFEKSANFLPSFTVTRPDARAMARHAAHADVLPGILPGSKDSNELTGLDPGLFPPSEGDGLSRAEAVRLIVESADIERVTPLTSSFADIPPNAPHAVEIETALAHALLEEWLI